MADNPAFDLSLNSTGVRFADGSCIVIKGLGPKHPEQERLAYLYEAFCRVLDSCDNPTAVYKEAPFVRRLGPGVASLLAVHGVLASAIQQTIGAVPVYEVSPTSLKKWATGSGKAEKPEMIDAAQWRGYEGDQNDEADAYLVWEYFTEHLSTDSENPEA